MASFNELRKMSVSDLLPGRSKRTVPTREQEEANNEKNRLSILDTPYQPALPGVNILPPEAIARRRSRRLVRQFITGGLAILLFSAVLYAGSVALNYAHQRQLDDVRATNSLLNSQLTQLQPYSSYQSSIDSARKSVSGSLAADLDVGRLLTDLNSVASRYGVQYTQINVGTTGATAATGTTSTTASTGQCLNPDPFNPPTSIGCITLSGTASSQSSATAFFNQFNSQEGFQNGFISSLTTGSGANVTGNRSTFNGTVAFDNAFYSNKYSSYSTPLSNLISGSGTSTGSGTSGTSGSTTPSTSSSVLPTIPTTGATNNG